MEIFRAEVATSGLAIVLQIAWALSSRHQQLLFTCSSLGPQLGRCGREKRRENDNKSPKRRAPVSGRMQAALQTQGGPNMRRPTSGGRERTKSERWTRAEEKRRGESRVDRARVAVAVAVAVVARFLAAAQHMGPDAGGRAEEKEFSGSAPPARGSSDRVPSKLGPRSPRRASAAAADIRSIDIFSWSANRRSPK